MGNKKNCFVIMPFGGDFDGYYYDIYKSVIEKCNLNPRRADDLYTSGPIISDIWNYILTSELIIADLSNKNPNVMYELGLAHAKAKPAILLSNSIESIPFDLRHLRIITYDTKKSIWIKKLKEDLESAIKQTLESPNDRILVTFLNAKPNKEEKITKFQKDIIEIKQSINLLISQSENLNELNRSLDNLSSEEYQEAIVFAAEQYYEKGYDLPVIRENIVTPKIKPRQSNT